MLDELLLLSGNDIPIPQAQLVIHQPRLKEIAYITETRFWKGCELLKFDKEVLDDKDKLGLSNWSNFNIIMSMIQEKNFESMQAKVNVISILTLLFPDYRITLNQNKIQMYKQETKQVNEINDNNFQFFKNIIIEVFCLSGKEEDEQYNPAGEAAERIAKKLMEARKKKAKLASSNDNKDKISILSRYISILAVGQQKDINVLMNYTVYQLMDQFRRYQLKVSFDSWEKSKIAGATDLEDPENWYRDLYSKEENANNKNSNDSWFEVL